MFSRENSQITNTLSYCLSNSFVQETQECHADCAPLRDKTKY